MKDKLGNKIEPGCIVTFSTGKLSQLKLGLAVIKNITEHWTTWYKDGNEQYIIHGYVPYITWKNKKIKLRKISFSNKHINRLIILPINLLNMEFEEHVLLKAKALEIIKDGKY